ncbi:hypothetical protein WH47_06693 [Habropoda laboriosa]|uniref:SAP domain-containing protein n=1 Tax=Habropoda laboriosa TaxID=597456 RepID=A0A0L7QRT4_9HYME|nr:hypothetical protein WH47_06693 [Habropoda laboriosa]
MNTNKNPKQCTAVQLKVFFKPKGLNTVGVKEDLMNKLVMSDPALNEFERSTTCPQQILDMRMNRNKRTPQYLVLNHTTQVETIDSSSLYYVELRCWHTTNKLKQHKGQGNPGEIGVFTATEKRRIETRDDPVPGDKGHHRKDLE